MDNSSEREEKSKKARNSFKPWFRALNTLKDKVVKLPESLYKRLAKKETNSHKERYIPKNEGLTLPALYPLKRKILNTSRKDPGVDLSADKYQRVYSQEYSIKEYLIRKKKTPKKPLPIITEEPIHDENLSAAIGDIAALSHPDLNDFADMKNPNALKDSKENNNMQGPQAIKSFTENKTAKSSKTSLVSEEDIYDPDLENSPFFSVPSPSGEDASAKSSKIAVLKSVIDEKQEKFPYQSKITESQGVNMEYYSDDSSEKDSINLIDKEDVMIVNVPSDGDCLLHAIATPYLLDVADDEESFQSRFMAVFGKSQEVLFLIKEIREHFLNYNPYKAHRNSLYKGESSWMDLIDNFRNYIVDYIDEHLQEYKDFICVNDREDYNAKNLNSYLKKMRVSGTFMGNVEIKAASELLNHSIKVTRGVYTSTYNENSMKRPISLRHIGECHYNFEWKSTSFSLQMDKVENSSSPSQGKVNESRYVKKQRIVSYKM